MVDQEEYRLQRMGLTKLEEGDTYLKHADEWGDKNIYMMN